MNKLAILSSKDKRNLIQSIISSSLQDLSAEFKFSNIERVDIYDILRTWQYEDVDKILIDIDSAVEYGRVNDLLLNLPRFQVVENSNGSLRIWLMAKNPIETYDRKFKKLIKKLGCEEIIVGNKLEQFNAVDIKEQKHEHQEPIKSKVEVHEEIAVNVPEDIAVKELEQFNITDDDIQISSGIKKTEDRSKTKNEIIENLPKSLSGFIEKPQKSEKVVTKDKSDTQRINKINKLSKDIRKKERNDSQDKLQKTISKQTTTTDKVVDSSTVEKIETKAQNQINNALINATIGDGDNKQVLIVLPPEYVKPQVRISFAERMYWRIKSCVKNFVWTLITVLAMSGIATYLINSDFGSEVKAWIKSML